MSIRIEVVTAEIEHRQVKNFDFYTQPGFAFLMDASGKPSKYPQKIEITHDKDSPPYQPGFYTLDPRSFYVGDYHKLSIGKMKLSPLPK